MNDETEKSIPLEKLAQPDLVSYLESGSTLRQSLLVEIEQPHPKVEFEQKSIGNQHQLRPKAVTANNHPESTGSQHTVEAARQAIIQITSQDPLWLESAAVFVVSCNAGELRKLLQIPMVSRIMQNSEISR